MTKTGPTKQDWADFTCFLLMLSTILIIHSTSSHFVDIGTNNLTMGDDIEVFEIIQL